MNKHLKKIAILAIIIVISLLFSYLDSLIIFPLPIPGLKMGLANIMVVYTLYKLNIKDAIMVSFIRLILAGILFGSIVSFLYGLVGAILSLTLMIILKKLTSLKMLTISIIGAIMHNIGQILVAVILMNTAEIALYLPILIITGIICGLAVGILSRLLFEYTKKINLGLD